MQELHSFKGKVILVGAGPGDPGLLTVRGRDYIQRADVVVYDHLVCQELVDLAPAKSRHIYVGKKVGKHTLSQEGINELLVREAKEGNAVVRLKGGDPFIFGRGAEECDHLRANGVEFEVVPGVSAAAAVPAYAGIPVTSRDYSTAFTAVTGHEHACKSQPQVNWASFAQVDGTLIVFMGILSIRKITDELMKHGKDPKTPAAVIRWGTYAHQKTLTGALENIADQVERANMRPPGLIVIGEVVRFRERLDWFETRPLFGRTIVVPRARSQASRLAAMLSDKGANVLEIPAARHEPIQMPDRLDNVVLHAREYNWILFPGERSAAVFFETLTGKGCDARSLAGCRIGALGEETSKILLERGIRADFVSTCFCSPHVVDELSAQFPLEGERFLLPCEDEAPEGLPHALQQAGAIVDQVVAAVRSEEEETFALNGRKIDMLVFPCSATVRKFIERFGEDESHRIAKNALIASIGSHTSKALLEYHFSVHLQPIQSDIPSLVDRIVEHFSDDSDKD
ncbi:MAG: uroporphyrinogen-III C-methyltransferase [Candidatus Omnitrophica bacterium]|nr:uroporphyrinogen-III C-methyltransferase [Candidatus Omnitrophota bacterium]